MRMNVKQKMVAVITTAPIYLGPTPVLALRATTWIVITGHAMVWMGDHMAAMLFAKGSINLIHPIGNSFKKQKPCTKVYST